MHSMHLYQFRKELLLASDDDGGTAVDTSLTPAQDEKPSLPFPRHLHGSRACTAEGPWWTPRFLSSCIVHSAPCGFVHFSPVTRS